MGSGTLWLIFSLLSSISADWLAHKHSQRECSCSLESVSFCLFLLLSITHSHICSFFFFYVCTCWISMVCMTHTSIQTLGGAALLHKHFHSEEDSSNVCPHRPKTALSQIQGSVWMAEGFPWKDPRGARGCAAPLKHWLSPNSFHMNCYTTGFTSRHACRNIIISGRVKCAHSLWKNPPQHKNFLCSFQTFRIFWVS